MQQPSSIILFVLHQYIFLISQSLFYFWSHHDFKIDIKYLIVMEDRSLPNPRWNEFIEEYDSEGKAIGFKLPNNDFLFKYEVDGGWEDEKGDYYNADGILEEVNDSLDEDDDELSDHDDYVIDQFEQLLREEEEGIVRRPKKQAEESKPEKAEKPVTEEKPFKEEKKQGEFDFKGLVEQFKSKERLREGLPSALFIYFKQKTDRYEQIEPVIQKLGSTELKNAAVKEIQGKIEQIRKRLLADNSWLNEEGVYLDYSGDSDKENTYDRYWFGSIRTSPEKYLDLIQKIKNSKEFKILEIKTFYALRSKFYLKKGEQKIRQTIAGLKAKIDPVDENKTVSLLIDGLPEKFPCSFIYDLVEYAGGKLEHVQSVIIEDDTSATITCLKETALSLIKIEGYIHDKGEFIEIEFNEAKEKVAGKHSFYYITVDSDYKVHESELHDTLAIELSRTGVAKTSTKEDDKKDNVRFVIGSIDALRKVLMFRGVTLNVVRVLPSVPKLPQ